MHSKHEEHMSPVPEIFEELRAGRMIVLVDDPDREDEGDLVLAAEKVTPQAIAFMAKEASGLICLALTGEQLDQLQLPPMARRNTARLGTAFTVSIEARHGVTTGISAADRAHTILAAIADDARPDDLVTPGHVFPLRARDGGVLVRTGQTEGSVDLARLAGLKPAAVICEVMNPDGTMSRVPELVQFCRKHGLKMTSVAHVIAWRHAKERLIERVTRARMPSAYGHFDAYLYKSTVDAVPHMVLTIGLPGPDELGRFAPLADPVLVRVHSECLTGDVFGSLRCDCGAQLHQAMQVIGTEGRGALLYMRQEGRGIGLENKMRAYHLQDLGYDTVEANKQLGFRPDERDFGIGAQILADLGIRKMRLLTNNPKKYTSLGGYDLEIVERVPLEIGANENNIHYLRTKREKLGHLLKGV